MKKVLSIVLTIAMVISLMPSVVFAAESATYTDIKGLKCEAAVEELSELGIVNGYEDGTYRPDNTVTRAEMAKLTVAALGLDPTSGETKFTDMDQAKWAIPYVGYAESLGIVNGYGGGLFGPNDKVTYDQAITMIVRMLGYTDDSQELQGTWPANYVQKANELGILKDVNKTGSDPAPRGDIAIMLANSLDLAMVYVDKDGKTTYKTGKDYAQGMEEEKYVTVRGTLTKKAYTGYITVDGADVDDAAKNIREYLGAAGKVVANEDGEIISVSDIKTQFMTGDFNEDATTFTSEDVDYKVPATTPFKALNFSTGKARDLGENESIPYFVNGEEDVNGFDLPNAEGVTIAATVSGKKITGIYSAQKWNISENGDKMVEDADLAQIEKNHTLLNYNFVENDDDAIDTDAFILAGVDSLDKIAADNVVYVYNNSKGIAKIEVGTETVSGKVTKSNVEGDDAYAVIDGTQYSFAAKADAATKSAATAGNEVDVYLDYNGDIYKAEKISSGNYAIVMEVEKPFAATTSFSSNNKIKLLTADGPQIFEVNNSKFKIDGKDAKDESWTEENTWESAWEGLEGNIVKVTFADENVKEISVLNAVTPEKAMTVTKQGYYNKSKINDSAMIFAVPYEGGSAVWTKDDEDYVAKAKADILDTEISATYYADGGKIEVMYFNDDAISESVFGVAYAQYKNEDGDTVTQYYAGKEDAEGVGTGTDPAVGTDLYKISTTSDGSATFESVTALENTPAVVYSASGNEVFLNQNDTEPLFLTDDVIIYIWDSADKSLSTDGIVSDLISTKNKAIKMYSTAEKESDDNYGLYNYIIIVR